MSKATLTGLLLLVFYTPTGLAHYMDIAQFTFFEQEQSNQFRLLVDNLPQTLVPHQPVDLPAGCELLSRRESQPGFLPSVELEIACESGAEGLIKTRWGRDGGVLEYRYLDGSVASRMLAGGRSGTSLALPDWQSDTVPQYSLIEAAWLYLVLGTEHVLIGLDHLAFVFCLAMLAAGRRLLFLITAFTVGHSLSLALSYLGVVQVSIAPVEAVIALSVVFMAREAILYQRAATTGGAASNNSAASAGQIEPGKLPSLRGRLVLTAGFGLIHGLGFASVLSDLGVPAEDTVLGLAFFNIGVEVGQVLFVTVVLLVVWLFRQVQVQRQFVQTALNLIGAMGLFWTLQRVIGI